MRELMTSLLCTIGGLRLDREEFEKIIEEVRSMVMLSLSYEDGF